MNYFAIYVTLEKMNSETLIAATDNSDDVRAILYMTDFNKTLGMRVVQISKEDYNRYAEIAKERNLDQLINDPKKHKEQQDFFRSLGIIK